MPRYTLNDLVFPAGSSPTKNEKEATVALLDAIALDHPVFVGYALDNGAQVHVRARCPAQSPDACSDDTSAPTSALGWAIHRVCCNEAGQARWPQSDDRDAAVVDRLLLAGAYDFEALQLCTLVWQDSDLIDRVKQANLNALLREARDSTVFQYNPEHSLYAKPRFPPLSVYAKRFGQSMETWLSIAVAHQRLDVVKHWFEQGGALNGPGLGAFRSALTLGYEKNVMGHPVEPELLDTLRSAWEASPVPLFRQEALHLMQKLIEWRATRPDEASRIDRVEEVVQHAVIKRGMDMTLTDPEREWLKTGGVLDVVQTFMRRVEGAMLSQTSNAPGNITAPRLRERL